MYMYVCHHQPHVFDNDTSLTVTSAVSLKDSGFKPIAYTCQTRNQGQTWGNAVTAPWMP